VNVGGLPRGGEMDEFESFGQWWGTIAPDYPDVPSEEPIWRGPGRSPFGAAR